MAQKDKLIRQVIDKNGGASRDRTDDLIVANDALSQLSYSPLREGNLTGLLILAAIPTHAKTAA